MLANMGFMGLIVQKFGGTSVANAEKIHRAARRAIRAKMDGHQVVLVVSAMGRTTDDLLRLAGEVSSHPPRREMDMLLTTGEQISIALMAMAINEAEHKAISLTGSQLGLVTDSAHTKARIQRINQERLMAELNDGNIVIVAGFQGTDPAGEITTLGRGASDTTAAALASVLGAAICEIYTDVDGIYTADPRIVPGASKMDQISYDEMLEMAGAGAGVMHSRAIEFAKRYDVPIHVRSSLTDTAGTMIMAETPGMEDISVRGVTLKEDLAVVTLTGVPNRAGIASEIFAEIARHHVLIDDISQTIYEDGRIANISFSTTTAYLPEAQLACDAVETKLGIAGVEIDEGASKVSAVGVGMRSHCGVAAALFEALSAAGINIETISTSEIVIGCIVRKEDGHRALQVAHDAFDLGEPSSP